MADLIISKPRSGGGGTGDGVFSQSEKLALELEMQFKSATASYFKELTYTDGLLSELNIYTDDTKLSQLFSKELTYTNGILTGVLITRISDNKTLTKTLTYDINDTLISVENTAS